MALTDTSTINYSGMLYAKTDEATRLLDAVYARNSARKVNSIEFTTSSSYSGEGGEQPAISETAALTAPTPKTVARTQENNVVQIFQRSVEVTYLKQSAVGQLGGLNVAGATNNVPNELDFQIARQMAGIKKDLNFTLANGVFAYTANSPAVASKSRGVLTAVTTNSTDAASAAFTPDMLDQHLLAMIKNGADITALEIWVNPAMLMTITKAYQSAGQSVPDSRDTVGTAYKTIVTNYGEFKVYWDTVIPEKTISFLNLSLIRIAELDVPGKEGGIFYEALSKKGASESGQMYGQLGIDYGPEWYHGKIHSLA